MFLGITGHAIREWSLASGVHRSAVDEVATVEVVDLLLQLRRMHVAVFIGGVFAVVLGFVTTEHKDICNTQERQVDKRVFGFYLGETAAYHVWHHGYLVSVLYGGRHGNCAGTGTLGDTLIQSAVNRFEHQFAAVGSDIDISRIEFYKFVNATEQSLDTLTLKRGEYLERKSAAGG